MSDRDGTIIRHGTLGSDMLSRFNVIYDYLNGAVYFKKTKEYKEEFKFNRAGFTFTALGKELNQYFIADIIPDSPAEKIGLQPNDEIIAIGNKPVFFYTFSEINGFLRGDTGTSFDIIIRRNGELFKKTLRLRKLI